MRLRARCEQEKENMKNKILNAAAKIIVTKGYDKLSMRKIADAIDYSPTTIYIYYKDKAQIVDDISRQIYEGIVEDIKVVLDGNKDKPLDWQLDAAFKSFINSVTNNAEMGKAVIRSGTRALFGPEESKEKLQEEPLNHEEHGEDILKKILQIGQQQSILRKLDDNMAWMLITSLIGFSMNAIENQLYTQDHWPELVDVYTKFLINGLLNRKE